MEPTEKARQTDGFGSWYIGPTRERDGVVSVPCPVEDCDGELSYQGEHWLTAIPGYHHTCDQCGYVTAISGEKYPRPIERQAFTPWRCAVCFDPSPTGVQQRSKCHGVGTCYFCGRVPVVREQVARAPGLEPGSEGPKPSVVPIGPRPNE